jgi:hypothetical protein
VGRPTRGAPDHVQEKLVVRPRIWAALAVLATVTLAACTGGGQAKKTTAEGRIGDTTATVPSTKVANSFDDLSKALDISVPDGYARQPDTVGDTGPSNLEKAISDDGEDDAGEVLTRNHFVRGYQRMWGRSEDEEIIVYVYQFADHAGAVDYTQRLTADSGTPGDGATVGLFNVSAIDGAVGVNSADPTFATSTVTFVKGPYSVQLVVNATSPEGLQSLASALAEDQFARL